MLLKLTAVKLPLLLYPTLQILEEQVTFADLSLKMNEMKKK